MIERLRLLLATGLGIGHAPVAPGTLGSLPGLLLVWLSWHAGGPWAVAGTWLLVTLGGLWAAGRAAAHFGRHDPGQIVIDEVAGQMLGLLFLAPTAASLVSGFLLFRLFDVWKPPPIRRLESLPGASGIMADDLLAGVYANAVQRLLQLAWASWGELG